MCPSQFKMVVHDSAFWGISISHEMSKLLRSFLNKSYSVKWPRITFHKRTGDRKEATIFSKKKKKKKKKRERSHCVRVAMCVIKLKEPANEIQFLQQR